MVVYQPLLVYNTESVSIPSPIVPFKPHTGTTLGTVDSFTGYNVQPAHAIGRFMLEWICIIVIVF